jgi:hypothetical protein
MSHNDTCRRHVLLGILLIGVCPAFSFKAEGQLAADVDSYLATKSRPRRDMSREYEPTPLKGDGVVFVDSASCVDPRLMVSVSGHETTFGLASGKDAHNAFGQKDCNNNNECIVHNYASWEMGITDATKKTEGMIFRWSIGTLYGLSHVYCGGPFSTDKHWEDEGCASWEGGVSGYYAEQLGRAHLNSEVIAQQIQNVTSRACIMKGSKAQAPPCLSANRLVFRPQKPGDTTVSKTAVKTLVIFNCSLEDLDVGLELTGKSASSFAFEPAQSNHFRLKPERRVAVSVQFDPHEMGEAKANILVHGGAEKSVILTGNGAAAQLGVPSDLDFGSVIVNKTLEKRLTIVNAGKVPTGNIAVSIDDQAGFHIGQIDTSALQPDKSRDFLISYSPKVDGRAEGALNITDSDGQHSVVSLHGMAISPRLEVNPVDGEFGKVRVGDISGVLQVTVANRGGAAANGLMTTMQDNGDGSFMLKEAELPDALPSGQELPLTILFSPTVEGKRIGELLFKCADCGALSLKVTGEGTKAHLELSSNQALDFGHQRRGIRGPERTIVLSNTGSADLRLNSVRVSGIGFGVDGALGTHTLATGAHETIQIFFNPRKTGTYTEALSIECDDSRESKSLALMGVGTHRFVISSLWAWIRPGNRANSKHRSGPSGRDDEGRPSS